MRILLVEDNLELSNVVAKLLRTNYQVDQCSRLDDATYLMSVTEYSLIVLDLELEDGDGAKLCIEMRRRKDTTPIMILTARFEEDSRVAALDAGADDYVLKPFMTGEFMARIRMLMRRAGSNYEPLVTCGDLIIDPAKRSVTRQGTEISLRRKEYDLLEYLVRHRGQAMSRQRILDQIWDYAGEISNNTVDVHIKFLRDRVDRPFGTDSIKTVHGIGYSYAASKGD